MVKNFNVGFFKGGSTRLDDKKYKARAWLWKLELGSGSKKLGSFHLYVAGRVTAGRHKSDNWKRSLASSASMVLLN